jgi:hypothetical protein
MHLERASTIWRPSPAELLHSGHRVDSLLCGRRVWSRIAITHSIPSLLQQCAAQHESKHSFVASSLNSTSPVSINALSARMRLMESFSQSTAAALRKGTVIVSFSQHQEQLALSLPCTCNNPHQPHLFNLSLYDQDISSLSASAAGAPVRTTLLADAHVHVFVVVVFRGILHRSIVW